MYSLYNGDIDSRKIEFFMWRKINLNYQKLIFIINKIKKMIKKGSIGFRKGQFGSVIDQIRILRGLNQLIWLWSIEFKREHIRANICGMWVYILWKINFISFRVAFMHMRENGNEFLIIIHGHVACSEGKRLVVFV